MSSYLAPLATRFPKRAARWQLRTRTLELSAVPLLMGIVNVTPDSFSDGGKFLAADAAIEQGLALVAAGAAIIDVGGESTRPFATPVDEAEELARVLPVVKELTKAGVVVSIDTSKARVAEQAIAAGAEIINDVTSLSGDPRMIDVARDSQAAVCAMHMQGTPQTMQVAPHYDNIVEEIYDYLTKRRDALVSAGIAPERIALDPGVGFGKTHQHNLTLAAHAWRFHELGQPLVVGHSRKGFIGKVLGDRDADRTFGSVGVTLALASQGVQIIRVHDVLASREALALYAAVGGITGQAAQIIDG